MVAEAERLGFDSIWTAEAYGSDALTPLSWWGSQTTGSGWAPPSASSRPGPRRPWGWPPSPWTICPVAGSCSGSASPGRRWSRAGTASRSRSRWPGLGEYVDIVRQVVAREAPVTSAGPHYPLPYPGGTGLGKPLKPIVHPLRQEIPIILGAEGPKNVALAAEIADGWFPIFFSPNAVKAFEPALAEGFARPGARHSADDFEVIAFAPTIIDDDIERAADAYRPFIALYIGGMGAKSMNFHFDVFARMGYEAEATQDPGALPRRPQGRGRCRRPHPAHRGHRSDRSQGEDPGRPRRLEGVDRHHAARCWGPSRTRDDGRASSLRSGRTLVYGIA